jgi:hypothetical protein
MAKRITTHTTKSDMFAVLGLCFLSFVFGGITALMINPTLREIDRLKNECLMTYSVSSKKECKVRIVLEPEYNSQQYR